MKKLLLIAIAALPFVNVAQSVPSYVPTNGLVGWWPFNGNANDESGNGNNGFVNGAILTSDRNGNVNTAYSFDGIDDYILCFNPGPGGNSSITSTFWIKTNQNSYGHIIGYGNNVMNSGSDYRVLINGNCNSSIAFDTYLNNTSVSTVLNNNWDFYAIVYDSLLGAYTSSVKIYKNTVLLNNICFSTNPNTINIGYAFPITFGRYHGNIIPGYFSGMLDDIGMWNRALNQQEINDLFTGSVTTSIKSDLNTNEFNFFPNPSDGKINIVSSIKEINSIILLDTFGRTIRTFNVNGKHIQISLEGIESGIYFLSVNEERSSMKKIFKE